MNGEKCDGDGKKAMRLVRNVMIEEMILLRNLILEMILLRNVMIFGDDFAEKMMTSRGNFAFLKV